MLDYITNFFSSIAIGNIFLAVILVLLHKQVLALSHAFFVFINSKIDDVIKAPFLRKLFHEAVDIVEVIYTETVKDAKAAFSDGKIDANEKRAILKKAKERALGELRGYFLDHTPKYFHNMLGHRVDKTLSRLVEDAVITKKVKGKLSKN